ncbi:branched-chain amino acid ABC transporter permease [Nocardia sp. NPDC051030]|uniref:branched-chain amino acid ABC transporter permease n=1 Tax=Nocardia sp. NPDC051030 TaxID=3155162 RepID=UPI003432C753
MSGFLQATIWGLLQGGLLAMIAVGFSLVWGVMNVVNLTHGSYVVMGAYTAWELNTAFGLDPLLGAPVAGALLFVIGYAVQRILVNQIVNAPIFLTLLLTFGLQLVFVQGMVLLFSADYRAIPTAYAGRSLVLGEVQVPYGRLIAFGVALLATAGLVLFTRHTRTGVAILATGMDRTAARLMGINARHTYALTAGLAAGLAGAAGALVGMIGFFSPPAAPTYTLLSFVVAVLGGLGNMYGALLGGLLLGVVQAWAGHFVGGTWVNVFAFGALVLVLVVRPTGLVGKAYYEARVQA